MNAERSCLGAPERINLSATGLWAGTTVLPGNTNHIAHGKSWSCRCQG